MTPIDFVERERRLLIHLKAERLMDVIFSGDRQGHGLGEHIRLPQAKHKAVSRWPRQLFQQVCRNPEMAERGFPAAAPEIDPNTVDLTRQRPHRVGPAAPGRDPPSPGRADPELVSAGQPCPARSAGLLCPLRYGTPCGHEMRADWGWYSV